MATERTLSIIKPDGVRRNIMGKVISRFEEDGLKIVAMRMIHMDLGMAQGFYAVHKARPFFGELTQYMASGPCVVMVLEGENAIARNREIMGATDPAKAAANTLRKLHAVSLQENTVHGSDAVESANFEIGYFFRGTELVQR